MQYTDTALVSTYLKRTLTSEEEATLFSFIPAVEAWIDRKLGTTFKKVEATTRQYDGGERSLDIEPCTHITKVEALDYTGAASYTYTDTQEYQAYPLNETVKTELLRRHMCWPTGDARIAVTAQFSSYIDEIPRDIQQVATKIVADILNQGSVNPQAIRSESLEGHSVTYHDPATMIDKLAANDPFVASILELRRDISIG